MRLLQYGWISLFLIKFFSNCFGAEVVGLQSDGERLATRLREMRPERALTNYAVLKIRGSEGRKSVPVIIYTVPNTNGWEVRYEVSAPASRAEVLSIQHTVNRPPFYKSNGMETNELKNYQRGIRFAGSDFYREDLGMEFLHWKNQRVIGRELSNGRICDILESRADGPEIYKSVRSWVDVRLGVILSAEAYDERQIRLKQFSVTHFREVEDQWIFSLSIVDSRTGTKTELSYEASPK